MNDQAFQLLRDDLKELKTDISDLRIEVAELKEDKAIKKGALYVISSIIAALVSISMHIFTGYGKH